MIFESTGGVSCEAEVVLKCINGIVAQHIGAPVGDGFGREYPWTFRGICTGLSLGRLDAVWEVGMVWEGLLTT